MPREGAGPVDVFISYSHRDEKLRAALEKHLASLVAEGLLASPWHDRKILPGDRWADVIDEQLDSAGLVLLLVSADFVASDYCREIEVRRALERHAAGEARVVPVVLRPCDWHHQPFGRLQALPKDGKAITTWRPRDAAYLDVATGIRRALDGLAPKPEPSYPNDGVKELSQALEAAYLERAEIEASGGDTTQVNHTIVGLKRKLREGPALQAGDFLLDGRFQLLEHLGQGGFARVWKAYDRQRRSIVAVKVLHSQYGEDRSRRQRFFRGARQMARLGGPGIVGVVEERCEDGGHHFFVMEHVGGGDFRQAVLAGRLSQEERFKIVLKVGAALERAHERGVIHRDVKPANILLDSQDEPKLTDFDLVRAADTTGGTRTSALGSYLYAAPEAMLDAKQAAEPADVYGLGMTALFALRGADLPFDVQYELADFLDGLDVSDACREALARAVARKVEERWATVADFCGALRAALEAPAIAGSARGAEVRQSAEASRAPAVVSARREKVHEKDGSVLVYVPGGEYTLGAEDIGKDSKPVHRVRLSPYWIGKHAVTNAQYRRFLEANPQQSEPALWDTERFNDPEQPVMGVSWLDALAYCRWAGLELPTEAQWEAAARGTDERVYPWGNGEPTVEHSVFDQDWSSGKPAAVGSCPKGSGPFGTLDQAGNVWEWCRDAFEENAYRDREGDLDPVVVGDEANEGALRVVRGGSWHNPSWSLRAAIRLRDQAWYRGINLGFRVSLGVGPEHGD